VATILTFHQYNSIRNYTSLRIWISSQI